ncbi:MAG: hypothetical protein ABFS03_00940 [Chloroflexota bacterium]
MSLNLDPPPKSIVFQEWIRWLVNLYEKRGRIESWHEVGATGEPAFQGTWADAGTNPAFYKDPLGRVHLKGDLDTGTSTTVVFTLPEGYRPSEALYFALHQTAAAAGAEALIGTNGDVTVTYTGAKVRLSGISFRVAE